MLRLHLALLSINLAISYLLIDLTNQILILLAWFKSLYQITLAFYNDIINAGLSL